MKLITTRATSVAGIQLCASERVKVKSFGENLWCSKN